MTLPPGVTRADVSITLSYYTVLGGDNVKVTLKRQGRQSACGGRRQDEMSIFVVKLPNL